MRSVWGVRRFEHERHLEGAPTQDFGGEDWQQGSVALAALRLVLVLVLVLVLILVIVAVAVAVEMGYRARVVVDMVRLVSIVAPAVPADCGEQWCRL